MVMLKKIIIGILAGIISGLFGAGGGLILVPAFVNMLNMLLYQKLDLLNFLSYASFYLIIVVIDAYIKNNINANFKYLFGIFINSFEPIMPPNIPPIAHFIPKFHCI